jgi:hypothetical protein
MSQVMALIEIALGFPEVQRVAPKAWVRVKRRVAVINGRYQCKTRETVFEYEKWVIWLPPPKGLQYRSLEYV